MIGAVLLVSGCKVDKVADKHHPAKVEETDQKGILRVTLEPRAAGKLAAGGVVLVRVHGAVYLHLIKAVSRERFRIGNNRGVKRSRPNPQRWREIGGKQDRYSLNDGEHVPGTADELTLPHADGVAIARAHEMLLEPFAQHGRSGLSTAHC